MPKKVATNGPTTLAMYVYTVYIYRHIASYIFIEIPYTVYTLLIEQVACKDIDICMKLYNAIY